MAILFILLTAFSLTPYSSPPLSLLLGLVFALIFGTPFQKYTKKASKYTLQVAIVGLGFGLDLAVILKAGSEGLAFTILTISLTLLLGWLIGRSLNVARKPRMLIAVGTAICGGSAIAAVGPVIDASDEEMSVALGTVFILNAIALFLFPAIGHLLSMSQNNFGLWAALAIHDTSSVVGATAAYGDKALAIGTTVKLSRALWIIPVALAFSMIERSYQRKLSTGKQANEKETSHKAKIQIPWFIAFFILASISRTFLSAYTAEMGWVVDVAKALFSLTLFLIGAGFSRAVLKKVGYQPLALGVVLWFIIGIGTLSVILLVK